MTIDALFKYIGSAMLVGSLFYLVHDGKMDVHEYVSIVLGILTALGIYHATMASPPAPPSDTTSETPTPPQKGSPQ